MFGLYLIMDFHHTDLSVLESMRKELSGLSYVWLFLHFDHLNKKGIRLEVKNEFGGDLSERKAKEVTTLMKRFCKSHKIVFKDLVKT